MGKVKTMIIEARKQVSTIIAEAKKAAADRKAEVTTQAEKDLKQAEEEGIRIEADARKKAEEVKKQGEAEVKKIEDACQNNKVSLRQLGNMMHSSVSLLSTSSDADVVDRTLNTQPQPQITV